MTTTNALALIASNPGNLMPQGHTLINGNIAALLREGLVDYDPSKHVGYCLTERGRAALRSSRVPPDLP